VQDLESLLGSLDPEAPLIQRHLWWMSLLGWIRGSDPSPGQVQARVDALLHFLHKHEHHRAAVQSSWLHLIETLDLSALFADFGFSPRATFRSELGTRLRKKLIPGTPDTRDAAELFDLAFSSEHDANWLNGLNQPSSQAIAKLLATPVNKSNVSSWECAVLDSMLYCASQIRAAGFSSELRSRMSTPLLDARPFHALSLDAQAFHDTFTKPDRQSGEIATAAQQLRDRLEACRQATSSVYSHLQEHGISVDLVFRLRQLRERIVRVRDLMDCLLEESPRSNEASTIRLLTRLNAIAQEQSALLPLIRSNTQMLAAKVTERSAEVGELYITRTHSEYRSMLAKAAGGGAVVALTTAAKFALAGLALSAFWDGLAASTNYALSFVLIQLLHWTLATKQPAMTATALAAKLKILDGAQAVEDFVDEVSHLVRSQMAAILGNLALVVPCVLLLSLTMSTWLNGPMISAEKARHVLHDLDPRGFSLVFAMFTGLLLFVSSLAAGWAENWFVLHRLDSVLRYNPRITHLLGQARAHQWADFWRRHISGFASNIGLALLLGLLPAIAEFFGLGLQVRHVTLSAGQLAAAAGRLGVEILTMPEFWWAVAGIALIGLANVGTSFYCAFRLAVSANNINNIDRKGCGAASDGAYGKHLLASCGRAQQNNQLSHF
jgi:site-specific recombinase